MVPGFNGGKRMGVTRFPGNREWDRRLAGLSVDPVFWTGETPVPLVLGIVARKSCHTQEEAGAMW
jgi:hypothetical protein